MSWYPRRERRGYYRAAPLEGTLTPALSREGEGAGGELSPRHGESLTRRERGSEGTLTPTLSQEGEGAG
jgi:hypothetical protein